MAIFTHGSTYLRTTTPGSGGTIAGGTTLFFTINATLTRERTILTDVKTNIWPNATTSYVQPGEGDIILTGIDNPPVFGTHEIVGGLIVAGFQGFTNTITIGFDHVVGREFGVVEGWHQFEAFDNDAVTFGTLEFIWDQLIEPDGFDGSEEDFPNMFYVAWDVTYDLDVNIDISGDLEFGEDTNLFFGIVEDNWVEEEPLTGPWDREL